MSSKSSKFCIVHFIEEESVEVVPDFWIFKQSKIQYCSWPLNNSFPTKCVSSRTIPDDKWPSYKCRILNSFDDYETARQNLGQAEITSDFPDKSKDVGKRIHKPNKKYVSDSSSSSDDSTAKSTNKSSLRKEKPRFTSKERSEMNVPKALQNKSKRILDVNKNLSSMPSRNDATCSRSPSPVNKVDESVDQFNEGTDLSDDSTTKSANKSSLRKEKPRFTSKERSEMDVPKTLQKKSKRILDVNKNLSSMPSRRNGVTCSRSPSPVNKIDKSVDQFNEDMLHITSQPEYSTSGTVVQKNQFVNQLAGQIQVKLTGKTAKSRYNGETEFEKQMVRDMTLIKFDMRAILEIVTTLSQTCIEKNGETNSEIPREQKPEKNILPNFPLQNWTNFLDLENLLQTEDTARAQLENRLYNRGGKVPAELIRRMLVYVFTPHLSLQISWLGRKKNQRLEGTHFARILFDAVKMRYKNIDDRIIESTIIDWFRRASDRIPKNRDATT